MYIYLYILLIYIFRSFRNYILTSGILYAAAAAKSLQLCPTVRPHRRQPTRLPHLWDSPGKNTGVGCHSFSNTWKWKVKVKSLSRVQPLAIPWTAAYQAPPSMGFSRQDYWSGLPFLSPILYAMLNKLFKNIYWHTMPRKYLLKLE